MSRRPRLCLADFPFHVIQRGNNRAPCFFDDPDRERYLDDLAMLTREHAVALHSYVLMTNHIHLLVTPKSEDGVSRLMKRLGQRYAQYVNRKYQRSGSLWDGRFRSCLVGSESYLLVCHRYIEENPVRAGMVASPADYRWSSHRFNAYGVRNALLTLHPAVEGLAYTSGERQAEYRRLFRDALQSDLVEELRGCTNGGFVFGPAAFNSRIAAATGRRVTPERRGPKRKAPTELVV